MEKVSTAGDLAKILKAKTEQEQSQTRELMLSEQQKLLDSLQSTYKKELDTTLNAIQEALQARLGSMALLTAQEAQTVEKMVENHQKRLTEALNLHFQQAKKAVRSQTNPITGMMDEATASAAKLTESLEALNRQTEATAARGRRRWMIGAAIAATVLLSISAGSWGLMRYLSSSIQDQLATIDSQQHTLQQLQRQTYGLELIRASNGTFLMLPPNAEAGYNVGGRAAIRLSN